MYSFMALWLLLATYAYIRGRRRVNGYAGGSHLLSHRHWRNITKPFSFLFDPACYHAHSPKRLEILKAVLLSGIGAMIFYLPWLIQLPGQFARVEGSYWVARPDPARLFTLLLTFITNLPLPNNWLPIALFISLMAVVLGVLQTIRIKNKEGFWIFYLSFAPPLLLFLFSQWKPVYIERALLRQGRCSHFGWHGY